VQAFAYCKTTDHAKSNQLPRDRHRQQTQRCQANGELEAAGREVTQSQSFRSDGKKVSSSGCIGSCAEFTAHAKSLGVKSNPKEKELF